MCEVTRAMGRRRGGALLGAYSEESAPTIVRYFFTVRFLYSTYYFFRLYHMIDLSFRYFHLVN